MKLKSPEYSKLALCAGIDQKTHIEPAILPPVPFSAARLSKKTGYLDQNDLHNSIEIWKMQLSWTIHDIIAQFINLIL